MTLLTVTINYNDGCTEIREFSHFALAEFYAEEESKWENTTLVTIRESGCPDYVYYDNRSAGT